MAIDQRRRYELEKRRLNRYCGRGYGSVSEKDRDLIIELCDAYNEERTLTPKPEGESHRTIGTLVAWIERCTTVAKRLDKSFSQASARDINKLMQDMHVKDGLSKTTVRNYQYAVRRLYRYHDLGVDPSDISAYSPESNGIDPQDILTRGDIEKLKEACDNSRDNAILHLLLYTGMRNTGLRTLRVKDVKVNEGASGRYRINPQAEGTKGAGEYGEWRPLLGATGAIRDWLKYHPNPEPENYLITQRPSYPMCDPTEPISKETVRHTTQKLMDRTDLDKPSWPHFMRHNFVSICRKDYDMDDDVIKWLIHHADSSDVMRTTYKHLSDSDWIKKAETSAGFREEEKEESPLTPMSCSVCGHSVGPNDMACSNCGNVFSPEAHTTKKQIEQDMYEAKGELQGEEEKANDDIRKMIEDNPEIEQMVLEKLIENNPELIKDLQ